MKAKFYSPNASRVSFRLAVLILVLLFHQLPDSLAQSKDEYTKAATISVNLFEGFYRFPNHVAYLQVKEKDGKLIAIQIWDKKQYEMIRQSEFEFVTSDEYKGKFIVDKESITGMMLNDRILLTRVTYNPEQKAALENNQLKILEGRYEFVKDKKKSIEITSDKEGLVLHQLWDGKKIIFYPRSEVDFYNDQLTFPLHFVIENEQAKQVICFGRDKWNKLN